MADDQEAKRTQGRSPPFPFISLERAIARLREFSEYSRGHPVRLLSALGGAWKYNPKSSGGLQTVAALKAFGLVADSGSNSDRRIQVSELGKRLLRQPPPEVRVKLLQEAALKPRLIGEYWKEWGEDRPPDEDCTWTLTDVRGFTPEAAAKFLSVFDTTIAYAGLARSDSLSASDEDVASDVDGLPDEDDIMQPEPSPSTKAKPPAFFGGEANVLAVARAEWTERLRDRDGIEIVVEFSREPSQDAYEYLRDYIDFKLGSGRSNARPTVLSAVPSTEQPERTLQNERPGAKPTVGVSLMITQSQKARLREMGVSEDEIRNMAPAEAHKRLDLVG